MDKMNENNKVTVMGEIVGEFSFSHEIYGEGFYMVDILVPRLSESADQIPLMVSERLLDVKKDYRGMKVRVSGQFRSYNRHEEKKNKLVLSVFVRDWEFIDEVERSEMTNHIELDGFICKEPVYRKTPLGRETCSADKIQYGSDERYRSHEGKQSSRSCTVKRHYQPWRGSENNQAD